MVGTGEGRGGIRGSFLRPDDEQGLSLLEVLVASLILSISAIGMAMLFGLGQGHIYAEGGERVAVFLAQRRIEELRTIGLATVTANPSQYNAQATCNCDGTSGWEAVPDPTDRFAGFTRCLEIANSTDVDGSGMVPRLVTVRVKAPARQAFCVALRALYMTHSQ